MPTFEIEIPVPAMGATVSELTVVALTVAPGDRVAKGQKLAELESDKSAFDFESPVDGTVLEIQARPGEVKRSGQAFFRLATSDLSVRHLAVAGTEVKSPAEPAASAAVAPLARVLVWTPRAIKLAQEAGLEPAQGLAIEATGPGGRVSGDDVARFLAARKT